LVKTATTLPLTKLRRAQESTLQIELFQIIEQYFTVCE